MSSRLQSLGLILEGFAFERQGRSASYAAAAADVIAEQKDDNTDPTLIWKSFSGRLSNQGLNVKLNPLVRRGTFYQNKKEVQRKTTKIALTEFAKSIDEPLVAWALRGLENDRLLEVHSDLCSVTGIGSKISSLFLRDLARRFRKFPLQSRDLLQPIDTWVQRTARCLGAIENGTASFILGASIAAGLNPESVNQGIWYFGAEVADSPYSLEQALSDPDKANLWLENHLKSLRDGANALSNSSQIRIGEE
jgi:hypothetical protein